MELNLNLNTFIYSGKSRQSQGRLCYQYEPWKINYLQYKKGYKNILKLYYKTNYPYQTEHYF